MKTVKKYFVLVFALIVAFTSMSFTGAEAVAAEENATVVETQDSTSVDEMQGSAIKVISKAEVQCDEAGVPQLDGYLFAGWYKSKTIPEDYDAALGAVYTELPAEGEVAYAKFVPEQVLDVKAQVLDSTEETGEKTDMRFVSTVDGLIYQEVGFVFEMNEKTSKPLSTKNVYDRIYKVGDDESVDELLPTEFCEVSNHFFTFTIRGITDVQWDSWITATPYWKTMDGTTVYGKPVKKMVNQGIYEARIGDAYYKTFAKAVLGLKKGDTIEVLRDVEISSNLTIRLANIAIQNVAEAAVTISRKDEYTERMFTIGGAGNVTIASVGEGLTMDGKNIPSDGAMQVNGKLTISGGYYCNHSASSSGGVVNMASGAETVIENSTFAGNSAATYGGVISSASTKLDGLTIESTSFIRNSAGTGGAVSIANGGYLSLKKCGFYENSATNGADVRTVASHVSLSGKIVAEFYSTSSTGVLNVADDGLDAGSDVRMKIGDISKVSVGATLVTFAKGTMSDSKGYIRLADEHINDYKLEYINGEEGNSDTAILSKLKAAKIGETVYTTLEEAITYANENSSSESPMTITIIREMPLMLDSTIAISENANIVITDDGNPRTIQRNAGNAGALFTVASGAKLTFTSTASDEKEIKLTIDGNKDAVTYTSGAAPIVDLGAGNCALTINKGVQFTNNRSCANGGVICTNSSGAIINITGGTFTNNEVTTEETTAVNGGVLYVSNGCTAIIDNTTFKNNIITSKTATVSGGVLVVAARGIVTIKNKCCFEGNMAVQEDNTGQCFGGAICVNSTIKDNVQVMDSEFTGNKATGGSKGAFGGAIRVGGSSHLTMNNCKFTGNVVTGGGTSGGMDICTGPKTIIHLSGKINGEFFNTSAVYTLDITDNLEAGSDVIMRWGKLASIVDQSVINFGNVDIMNASKEYFHLDSTAYELSFDEDSLSATVVSKTIN